MHSAAVLVRNSDVYSSFSVTKFKPGGGTVDVDISQVRDGDVGSPLTSIVDEESEADA